jgi:hypothetical protein
VSCRVIRRVSPAEDVREVLAILDQGNRRKTVAATALNRDSSRAHTVFVATVQRRVRGSRDHRRVLAGGVTSRSVPCVRVPAQLSSTLLHAASAHPSQVSEPSCRALPGGDGPGTLDVTVAQPLLRIVVRRGVIVWATVP